MIQKFLPIEMQLPYQVDGEPLEQLPNGYSDYYVPDGFERDREQEFERAENFLHVYSSKESGKGGVSNTIMGNISRDEIMKIAENVF